MEIIFICTRSITFNTFLQSQANYLSHKGFKVKVACSDIEKLKFKKKSCYTINFPNRYIHLINIFKYAKIFLQIRKLIIKNKSSIFYLHTPVASIFFRLFSLFYNLKIIYFVHGFRFTSKTNFLISFFFKILEKLLSQKTKVFITINYEDFNYVQKNFSKKVPVYKINGIGLDLNRKSFKTLKKKKQILKIIVIAAYKKAKGYNDLLKIAELIKDKQIKIICYGYGNYENFQAIKKKKQLNNIFFKTFDKNLKYKIKNYDLLLHLSKREGLPVSVMECLSKGLPVICYNIRGNNDLIKDHYNGFFVNNCRDAINKILFLDLNNKIFNKMRYNAMKSITQDFSKKKINKNILRIIKHNFSNKNEI